MKKHKYILIGLLILIGTLFVQDRPQAPLPQPKTTIQAPTEKPLVEQINDARAKVGKPPLTESAQLDTVAKDKVNDQVARNYWAHHLPGESTFQFFPMLDKPTLVAENLAACQTSDAQRVKEWIASPPHYAAMIGDYNEFGWAEKVNPADNNCMYTVTYFMKE